MNPITSHISQDNMKYCHYCQIKMSISSSTKIYGIKCANCLKIQCYYCIFDHSKMYGLKDGWKVGWKDPGKMSDMYCRECDRGEVTCSKNTTQILPLF